MVDKLTTEKFIKKSIIKHGNYYNYASVVYESAHVKVKIVCPEHGVFYQTPADHANRGRGCPKCGLIKKAKSRVMPVHVFIEKSNAVHNFKYQYSKVVYKASQKNVVITCPHHGDFLQMPTNHLSGKGCIKCGDESVRNILRLTTKQFIEKAERVHGGKYDYHKVMYHNNHTKIKIICPDHGVFRQVPMAHIAGRGCPSCSLNGFHPYRKSFIYVVADDQNIIMKIGITNDLKVRMGSLKHFTPFSFLMKFHIEVDGDKARYIEKTAIQMGKSCGFKDFHGCTEWVKYDEKILKYISAQSLNARDSIELKLAIDNRISME